MIGFAEHANTKAIEEERDAALAKLAEIQQIAERMASECGSDNAYDRGYERASTSRGEEILDIINRPAA